MLTAHLQAILTFDPIKHETCQEASRTCMATVIEDVREKEGQGKYAAHFLAKEITLKKITLYVPLLKVNKKFQLDVNSSNLFL